MGKDKEQRTEAPGNAFTRMNYLYQAAELMTKMSNSKSNPLGNYYNKIMKEISKKVVEKLHPDLKRTICCACNNSLTAGSDQINVKIKPQRRKKRKRNSSVKLTEKPVLELKTKNSNEVSKYVKTRIEARNKKPNKLSWICGKCGYRRNFLQKPSYKLWIHEVKENQ